MRITEKDPLFTPQGRNNGKILLIRTAVVRITKKKNLYSHRSGANKDFFSLFAPPRCEWRKKYPYSHRGGANSLFLLPYPKHLLGLKKRVYIYIYIYVWHNWLTLKHKTQRFILIFYVLFYFHRLIKNNVTYTSTNLNSLKKVSPH